MEELEHFFPAVIIAVNDGYFKRSLALNQDGHWEYRFGHKMPFARTTTVETMTWGVVPDRTLPPGNFPATTPNMPPTPMGTNPRIPASSEAFPVIIADTMNGRNINVFYPNWVNDDNVAHWGDGQGRWVRYAVDGRALDSIEGTAHHQPSIAIELLKAIDSLMRWNASPTSRYREGGELRIPADIVMNFASENVTFVGPMVLAIADNFTWLGNQAMSFWTLSNTQIVVSPQVYIFAFEWVHPITLNIIRHVPGMVQPPGYQPLFRYSLCDPYGRDIFNQNMMAAPPHGHGRHMILSAGGSVIHQVFNSEESAAIFGAYPDTVLAHLCS